ncbi:WxL protein peptidoglycan domain-containing protein [Paenibacillus sp. L3-i20]|uniref:WxL protein peptidoglycan domain-containing protein n=1 Tax=Paenibacillus sp. L3-i20 TaxID=2905833 RepID=UPI001EDD9025|nr:DUF916 domain-containing protein [Paenibacillus sp. L3-i20]GKU77599.1 hypothetical protein L3i20_v219960 [Paenibacillus sp. L3-i20]
MVKKIIALSLVFLLLVSNRAMAEINIIAVDSDKDYYDVEASTGQVKTFQFKLINNGTKAAEAFVYPSQQLTAINGGQAFIGIDDEIGGNGKWFSNSKEVIKLSPNETKTVKYEVSIPNHITDGQYILAIVSLNKNVSTISTKTDKNTSISGPVDLVIAKQIVLNVGTNFTRSITIDSFSYTYDSDGSPVIGTVLTNNGTILEKPKITIHIKSDKNTIVESVVLNNQLSFYQGTEQIVRLPSQELLKSGNYKAQVIVEYSNKSIERMFDFSVKKADVEKSLKALKETKGSTSEVQQNETSTVMYFIVGSLLVIIVLLLLLIFFIIRKKANKDSSANKGIGG